MGGYFKGENESYFAVMIDGEVTLEQVAQLLEDAGFEGAVYESSEFRTSALGRGAELGPEVAVIAEDEDFPDGRISWSQQTKFGETYFVSDDQAFFGAFAEVMKSNKVPTYTEKGRMYSNFVPDAKVAKIVEALNAVS
jgi:hypothetical protein